MEARHTPGPWSFTADPLPNGTPYFWLYAGDPYGDPETMGFGFASIMREPDILLVAAAPDLLAALRGVLTAHGEQFHEAFADARAAIAKATGEAP